MTAMDRAISWLSPQWAAQRIAWRKIEASYRGASGTRLSEDWQRGNGYRFGTSLDRAHVASVRDRAYQAYDNNPVARTLVQTETDHVIGDGLNYQPTSSSKEWNREAKDRYYQWLENCSVRGGDVEAGCELQRSLWSYSRVAGDIAWLLVARDYVDPKTGVLIVDSRIQAIRAENIATPDDRHGDKDVYDGIRFDQWGRPTEFYILSHDDRGARRQFIAQPARDVVWFPHMTTPSQSRPPSCYVTIFDLLAHLDRYVDGVSLAAWMATVFGIVFKKTNASQQFGQLPTLTNSQGEQQRAVTFENGMVKYIGVGEEVAQVQASQPMQQTPEFIRTMYRMLGQPFDMPLEVLAKDMSTANFASARIGLLPFYRTCAIKAARFGSRWSRTIRWWLSREALRSPADPKRWKNAFPADYWNHELLLNAFDYTDPVSEAQSDLLQVDAGFKSPQMVISERGRDMEQILMERKEWQERTKDLPQVRGNYTRDPVTAPAPVAPPANEDEPNDDNDE